MKEKNKNKWGYIFLWRKLKEHWLWEDRRPRTKFEAWIDLLWLASHDNTKKLVNGSLVKLKTGQRDLSIRFLMKRWKWSNTKVQTFLKLLKEDNMISTEISTGQIVVTICNYETYQRGGLKNSTPTDTQVGTQVGTGVGTETVQDRVQREELIIINNNLKKTKANRINETIDDYDGDQHVWVLKMWKRLHNRFGLHQDSFSGYSGVIRECYQRIGVDKLETGVTNFLKDKHSKIRSIRYFLNEGIDSYLVTDSQLDENEIKARSERYKQMLSGGLSR